MRSRRWPSVDRLALIVAAIGATIASAAAQTGAGCTPPFRFVRGGVTAVEGRTQREQVCLINYGRRSIIVSYALTTRPKHGTIGSAGNDQGRYRTAYRPHPGYVGPDAFEADIRFRLPNGRDFATRMRVNMTVLP
jgi:hypothetical protein